MPNKRIDQLNPNFDALTGNELIPIFDTSSNTTERITLNTLANFVDNTTDTFVTGATYNNVDDVLTLGTNNNGFIDVTINRYNRWYIPSGQTLTTPSNFQSFIYGDLIVDGTLMLEENSQLVVLNGDIILSGGTISGTGTTYIVDLPEFNTFVTSGNFNPSTKQITFTGNFGFTPFNVDLSSLSTDNFYTTGTTLNGNVVEFNRNDISNAYSVDLSPLKFTGNTISECIPDIYVTNVNSCSPLHIQPLNNGDVYISESGGFVGIGTTNPKTTLDINGDVSISNSLSATTFYGDASNLKIVTTPTVNNSLNDIIVRDTDGSFKIRNASTLGSSMNYSNVTFVDAVNGNDLTGTINRFDRPYLTVASALAGSISTPGLSSTNRGLVYVRRGVYNNVIINFQNNIDIYCEPGVVFTGQVIIRDNGLVVDSEFLGYVKIINSSANEVLRITADSFITFEFDTLTSTGPALGIFCPTLNNQIIIKGNNISADNLGFGYCMTIRDGSNVILDIKNKIESQHLLLQTRRVQGNIFINASQMVLKPGNLYGGNWKMILWIGNSTANPGRLVVNADLVNQDPTYYGGISSIIRFWESPNTNVKINGNIVGGVTLGAIMSNGASTMTIDGDVSSNLTALASDGSNNLIVMNSSIVSSGTVVSNYGSSRINLKNCTLIRRTNTFSSPFTMGGSSTTYINDCTYYNEFFGNSLNIESGTASLYIKDFVSEGFFTGGTSYNINNNVGNPPVGIINMVSNKVNNPALTPLYSYGAVVEPNLNVPKFF